MSEQADTRALRALVNGMRNLRFYVFDLDPDDDNDKRVFARDEEGDVHLVEEMPREAKDAIVAILNAAPALLDAADERDGLRARVAELEYSLAITRNSRDSNRARVAEMQEPRCCSVCAGHGDPTSGRECVCGGIGTEAAEILGLRATAIEMAARVAELERGDLKWAETCDDLRASLATLEAEVERVRGTLARAVAHDPALAPRAEVQP